MEKYTSVAEIVQKLAPLDPVHVLRRSVIDTAVRWFVSSFRGDVLYAIKTNPDEEVIKQIYASGVKQFDVASLYEIELVHKLFPGAKMYYMHSVKNRDSISIAYNKYGIRDFSLDSFDELEKIISATGNASDLNLYVRLAIANTYAELDLSGKFGIQPGKAIALLQKARESADKLGICFHVGSQCMHPNAYKSAIRVAGDVIKRSRVRIDSLDIGGGFPSVYPGMTPPPLEDYMKEIHKEIKKLQLGENCKIMCEPGRALVAESGSVIVRVDLRKDQFLYINDGTYGSLFDAGKLGFIFPVKLVRPGNSVSPDLQPFSFYGPTCDSMDFMKGPFYLPSDIREGDYIEIGQLGAYGNTLRTKFNGFFSDFTVESADAPMLSMFGISEKSDEPVTIEAA